ncbi:protein dj-1beta-like [Dermatophagoides pteronyssinus]|uniref:protein dj-1beta-like n=1 Tax=Dermatophagoides pteronyssinus TaxID=6956 RepID=UPI003F679D25
MFLYNRTLQLLKNKLIFNHFDYQRQQFYSIMSTKKALVILTEGAEEMELVITADVLRRAQIDTTIAGLNTINPVKCSRNVMIVPDKNLSTINVNEFDAFVLPGGMQAANTFAKDEMIGKILKQFEQDKKVIAIICASPIALKHHDVGLNRRITSHPSVAEQLTDKFKYSEDRVVNDNGLITSRGPGSAFEFALEIVRQLLGETKAKEIQPPMMLKMP